MPEEVDEFENRLDQDPPAGWRPEPGNKVSGKIVQISEGSGEYGSYPLIVLETAAGTEVAIHAFHTVLKSQLAGLKPQVGDRLGLKYLGIPEGKNYEAYRVIIDRAESSPGTDWGKYEEAESGPSPDGPDWSEA